MTISSYHIQNIIRAYGERLGRRNSLRKLTQDGRPKPPDTVTISEEGKKRQITNRLAEELVARLGDAQNGDTLNPSMVERLSQEFGGRLEAMPEEGQESGFKFKVLDPEKGEIVKEFAAQNIDELIRNLTNNF